jgi:hypothetical protein
MPQIPHGHRDSGRVGQEADPRRLTQDPVSPSRSGGHRC